MVGAFDSVCHSTGEFAVGGLGSWFDNGSHSRAIADMEWLDLNFPKNLHSNTGTGDYFPKKVISS